MRAFETTINIKSQGVTNGYKWIIYNDKLGFSHIGFPYGNFDSESLGAYKAFIVTENNDGRETSMVYLLYKLEEGSVM